MENVIGARRGKVLSLSAAVQEAGGREEALATWERLEPTLFGAGPVAIRE